jgi:hypothetical protein
VLERQLADESGESRAPPPEPGGGGKSVPPPVGGYLGRGPPPNAGAVAVQALAQRILPTPTLTIEGKVCSVGVGVTPLGVGIGGGCSLENIGTGTMRIVSGRIVSEGAI